MEMLYVYLASMIVGGIMLLTTVLFGGDHDTDSDVDLAADHDVDLHAEVDQIEACEDVDHEVDSDVDHDVDHGVGHAGATSLSSTFLWLPFFSLRFWVFFATFFGLTGSVFHGFHLAGSGMTVLLAVVLGAFCGSTAAYSLRWLSHTETGGVLSGESYIGLEGMVCLPLDHSKKGKIKVNLEGQVRELIALHVEEGDLTKGERVTILRLEGDVAYVTRSDNLLQS